MLGRRLEALASSKIVMVLVLIICLGLRLGMGYYNGDEQIIDKDAGVWMQIAENLNAGHGLSFGKESWETRTPTAYSEPGYPAFLALVYRTIGDGPFAIYIAQAVVDTLTCLIVMLFTSRIAGRRLPGLLAGVAYAIYPPFIMSTATPMTETFSTFVITVALFAAVVALDRSTRYAALAGLLMGIAMLVRSPMTFFPIMFAIILLLRRSVTPAWGWKCLAYVGLAYAVFCPWVIRNYIAMDALILVPTRGSMAVWGATGVADGYTLTNWNYPVDSKEIPRYQSPHPKIPDVSEKTYLKITRFQARMGEMGEVERDRALRAAALDAIVEHPGRFAFLGVKKVFRLWLNLWYDWPASIQSKAIAGLNAVCILLAVLGFRRATLTASYKWIALATVLYVTGISIGSAAVVRYSYPFMPHVLILAAAFVAHAMNPGKPKLADGQGEESSARVASRLD
jgi:4-amino-4-deoxy-L-arabinose transferase-like glycosyltransferase